MLDAASGSHPHGGAPDGGARVPAWLGRRDVQMVEQMALAPGCLSVAVEAQGATTTCFFHKERCS